METSLETWDGTSIVLDQGTQWMLRPGDLVDVDLSAIDEGAGFDVPIESLDQEAGQAALFIVDDGLAKRIPVQIRQQDNLDIGSLTQVESDQLSDGMTLIVGGVHYLRDGEAVQVVENAEVQ